MRNRLELLHVADRLKLSCLTTLSSLDFQKVKLSCLNGFHALCRQGLSTKHLLNSHSNKWLNHSRFLSSISEILIAKIITTTTIRLTVGNIYIQQRTLIQKMLTSYLKLKVAILLSVRRNFCHQGSNFCADNNSACASDIERLKTKFTNVR